MWPRKLWCELPTSTSGAQLVMALATTTQLLHSGVCPYLDLPCTQKRKSVRANQTTTDADAAGSARHMADMRGISHAAASRQAIPWEEPHTTFVARQEPQWPTQATSAFPRTSHKVEAHPERHNHRKYVDEYAWSVSCTTFNVGCASAPTTMSYIHICMATSQ